MATATRTEPAESWMRQAYAALRRPSWPDTFEAAMQDQLCRALMHGAAVRMCCGTWPPMNNAAGSAAPPRPNNPPGPAPAFHHATASTRPSHGIDLKRRAANDNDE